MESFVRDVLGDTDMPKSLVFLCIAAAVAFFGGSPAMAQDKSAQCWTPQALAARPEEKAPRKKIHDFDTLVSTRKLAPFASVPQDLRGSIRRVALPPGKKLLALTFDLCEQPGEVAGYDGAIVDYLRANNIKATFFAGGKWLASHEERALQLMADPLFEIGSHGWAHRNARGLDPGSLAREIEGPQRAYEGLREQLGALQCQRPRAQDSGPARIKLFRFPYGACDAPAMAAVNGAGLLAIQWDAATADPSPAQSAGAIAAVMLRAKPGSIVIGHANGRGFHTAEALPLAIPKLQAAGFEFVTVSELLAAGKPVIAGTCYNARPGDTDHFGKLFASARRPKARPAESLFPSFFP